jgi:hypothetical protein
MDTGPTALGQQEKGTHKELTHPVDKSRELVDNPMRCCGISKYLFR